MTDLDGHSQPNPRINAASREDRALHELLGVCRGILLDGVVTEDEAIGLRSWMDANPEAAYQWPGSVIAGRLNRMFEDLRIDDAERADLRDTLEMLVEGHVSTMTGANATTSLPLDQPAPTVEFDGNVFVLTGRFAFGPRRVCQGAVQELGGVCEPRITQRTNYLVLGTFASRDWAHTSYGRKIEQAVEYRDDKGLPLAIVAEDQWATAFD